MNILSKSYNINLANYFANKSLYLDEPNQKKPNTRKLVEQPWQQTKGEIWDEVTNTLCNLDFIQAKAAAKMTYELVNDFYSVLEVIPDNAETIRQENERQARMDKYTRDLIACAKEEITIDKLEIPKSITPWTDEQIDAEIERIRTDRNRAVRLKDFLNFLGQETANLQRYASEFPYFVTQQAWNFANNGPVGKAAEKGNPEVHKTLLLRSQSNRPTWNPFPVVLRTIFSNRKDGNYYASSIVITPDGRQAILSSENGSHLLWDFESGVIKKETFLHPSVITITKDGRYVVSASSNGTYILWEFQSGEIITTFYGNCESFLSIAITPDRRMAVTSSKNTCILWDLQSGRPKKKLSGIAGAKHIVIAPDSNQVVLASHDYCTILDLKRNKSIKIIKGEFIAITHDGKQGIKRTNELCILWDIQNDHPSQFLEGHYDFVSDISITLDGKLAITASQDKTCILWDLQSGKPLKILDGHFSFVYLVKITPDGKHAVSKSNDNTFILWNLENGKPIIAKTKRDTKVKRNVIKKTEARLLIAPL